MTTNTLPDRSSRSAAVSRRAASRRRLALELHGFTTPPTAAVLAVAKNYARAGGSWPSALLEIRPVPYRRALVNIFKDRSFPTASTTARSAASPRRSLNTPRKQQRPARRNTTPTRRRYKFGHDDRRDQRTSSIYSSAGGVIGMVWRHARMVNHGDVSSTDVAGGIIGATYVTGGSSTVTTTVSIDTAITARSAPSTSRTVRVDRTIMI